MKTKELYLLGHEVDEVKVKIDLNLIFENFLCSYAGLSNVGAAVVYKRTIVGKQCCFFWS